MSQHEFRNPIYLEWIDPKSYWKNNNNKMSIDEVNDNDVCTIATRSYEQKKAKSAHASADSFKQNGNVTHRMSRSI